MRDKISRYRSEEETDKLLEEQFIREAEEMEARILRAAGQTPWKSRLKNPRKKSAQDMTV